MPTTFHLPELGENIHGGDLVRVTVAVGDRIAPGDPVLEVETDKAVIEVPANLSGTVLEILVKPGTKIQVGQAILQVEPLAESLAPSVPVPAAPAAAQSPEPVPSSVPVHSPPALPPSLPATPSALPPAPATATGGSTPAAPAKGNAAPGLYRGPVPASPSVRREARELGVDIREVAGSGPHGRITLADVRQHVRRTMQRPSASAPASLVTGHADPTFPRHGPLPDFSRWGVVTSEPMSNVRRTTATHLAATWNTIPQVTGHDRADITDLEAVRKKLSADLSRREGVSLTLTAILVKVVATALRLFPNFNAAVDMTRQEIVRKHYIHIGIAVDTPHGLLVPVLRDAGQKNLTRIATELAELSARARARKLKPEEMQGGCFTISNLGGIGGTGFTPIINYPEVAILGVSQGRMEPVYGEGGFQPRLVLPLSLSYDHRLIDGGDGTRFLRWIREALEQPLLLLMEG
ncbi:MAG: 2-oxo acid dehydrogenase subunit E2 [Magnetococcales bacterium]|nr:2-oxo acid dehydrogenase subunit E2 [Magnetococcales bacterium]